MPCRFTGDGGTPAGLKEEGPPVAPSNSGPNKRSFANGPLGFDHPHQQQHKHAKQEQQQAGKQPPGSSPSKRRPFTEVPPPLASPPLAASAATPAAGVAGGRLPGLGMLATPTSPREGGSQTLLLPQQEQQRRHGDRGLAEGPFRFGQQQSVGMDVDSREAGSPGEPGAEKGSLVTVTMPCD